jgi:acyl-CoA synthetase (NDP forming)
MPFDTPTLSAALNPSSIAIVGASDNPDKVGGRPLMYLSRFGYRGRVYPVNAGRRTVQGHSAYPSVADLPESPNLAVIAVPAEAAVQAVAECAAVGANIAIVMSAGFAETGPDGAQREAAVLAAARASGMRVVGPNSQGLVNFGTGTVATFSTMFLEVAPTDGPVAIVSQSGIMSVVPYALLRARGIGVRHSHATGNSADVTLAEMAWAVLHDPEVRLLLLYLESIPDPNALAAVATLAHERDVPIVAVKAGRTPAGQAAAQSHTASLASEDRLVESFLRQHGIWRATDMHALVNAAELYLKGWKPKGPRLAVISNSGATCVMAADAVDEVALELAEFSPGTIHALKQRLPAIACAANPLDVTGALLTDSGLVGDTLAVAAADPGVDVVFLGIPVAGQGYDVTRFASGTRDVIDRTGKPVVVATSVAAVADSMRAHGVPTFDRDRSALDALAQVHEHHRLRRRSRRPSQHRGQVDLRPGDTRFLSEAASLEFLARAGLPVVPWRLCRSQDDVRAACRLLRAPLVAKGCSPDVPHKSEHGLVTLEIATEDEALAAFDGITRALSALTVEQEGVILASLIAGYELALGARVDPSFGPVVMIGSGGRYVEALADVQFLLAPFGELDVLEAVERLRAAPLLRGIRGERPRDLPAFCAAAVRLGDLIDSGQHQVASIDINPVILGALGSGVTIVDAVVERATRPT